MRSFGALCRHRHGPKYFPGDNGMHALISSTDYLSNSRPLCYRQMSFCSRRPAGPQALFRAECSTSTRALLGAGREAERGPRRRAR